MSLQEVQQGQAQSLLPKTTQSVATPTPAPAPTTVSTRTTTTTQPRTTTTTTTVAPIIPLWKQGPAVNTAVQPAPVQTVTIPKPSIILSTGGAVPISVKEPAINTAIQPTPIPVQPTVQGDTVYTPQQLKQQAGRQWVLNMHDYIQQRQTQTMSRNSIKPDQQYVMADDGPTWSKGQILTGKQIQSLYDKTLEENKEITAANTRATSQYVTAVNQAPKDTFFYKDEKSGQYVPYEQVLKERKYKQVLSEYAQAGPIVGAIRYGTASFLNAANPDVMVRSTNPLEQFKAVTEWETGLSKDPWKKFVEVQKPWYENVIIPMAFGAGVGAAGSLASKASKVVTVGKRSVDIYKGINTGTKVIGAGALAVGVGTDIGYTAAMYNAGKMDLKEVEAKALGYGLQFGSMGIGGGLVGNKTRTQMKSTIRQASDLNLRGGQAPEYGVFKAGIPQEKLYTAHKTSVNDLLNNLGMKKGTQYKYQQISTFQPGVKEPIVYLDKLKPEDFHIGLGTGEFKGFAPGEKGIEPLIETNVIKGTRLSKVKEGKTVVYKEVSVEQGKPDLYKETPMPTGRSKPLKFDKIINDEVFKEQQWKMKQLQTNKDLGLNEFFHGTTKQDVILKHGLEPKEAIDVPESTFLTKDYEIAKKYAGETGRVLKVRLTDEQLKNLTIWEPGGKAFVIREKILPSQISLGKGKTIDLGTKFTHDIKQGAFDIMKKQGMDVDKLMGFTDKSFTKEEMVTLSKNKGYQKYGKMGTGVKAKTIRGKIRNMLEPGYWKPEKTEYNFGQKNFQNIKLNEKTGLYEPSKEFQDWLGKSSGKATKDYTKPSFTHNLKQGAIDYLKGLEKYKQNEKKPKLKLESNTYKGGGKPIGSSGTAFLESVQKTNQKELKWLKFLEEDYVKPSPLTPASIRGRAPWLIAFPKQSKLGGNIQNVGTGQIQNVGTTFDTERKFNDFSGLNTRYRSNLKQNNLDRRMYDEFTGQTQFRENIIDQSQQNIQAINQQETQKQKQVEQKLKAISQSQKQTEGKYTGYGYPILPPFGLPEGRGSRGGGGRRGVYDYKFRKAKIGLPFSDMAKLEEWKL